MANHMELNWEYIAMNTNEGGDVSMPEKDASNVEPLVHWVTLNEFRLEVLGHTKVNARCYKNTRQQVPIKVTLDARNENGEQVSLTATQMQGITLCYYESSEPMGGWSRKNNQYEYDFLPLREDGTELPLVEEDGLPGTTANTITLYMATSMIEKKVAASITSSTGVVYRSNTPNAQPGSGKFDSWINVVGVEVPIHQASAFAFERHDVRQGDRFDVDLYYLRFNDLNAKYRIKGSLHLDTPADHKHYSWDKDGWQEKACFAFAVDELRTISYGQPNGGFHINDKAGQANAARIATKMYWATHLDTDPRVVYYDQYGNPGMVRYVVSSNGNMMTIANAGDPPRDWPMAGE